MKKYTFYTIFEGQKLFTNVIDDMNTTEKWAIGGYLWGDKKKAIACSKNINKYGFETKVVKVFVNL